MSARLNPKLTRRGRFDESGTMIAPDSARSAYSVSSEASSAFSNDSYSSFGASSEGSGATDDEEAISWRKPNPRIHLLHNGKWVPKQVCHFY